jgi:hypothetical protein
VLYWLAAILLKETSVCLCARCCPGWLDSVAGPVLASTGVASTEVLHLYRAMELAAPALAELHRGVPPAVVVHGDFVLRDARTGGFATDPIVARCIDAGGTDSDLVRRQLVLGGVCFSLLAPCWIVEEGLRTVPPSKDRIDGLLTELDDLTGELR